MYCQLCNICKSLAKLGKVFNYGAFNNNDKYIILILPLLHHKKFGSREVSFFHDNQSWECWGKLNLFFMPGDIGETFGEKMQSLFLHENPQVNTLFS